MFKKNFYSPTLLLYYAYCQLWAIKLSFYSFFFRLSKLILLILSGFVLIYPLNSFILTVFFCSILVYSFLFFCCHLINQLYAEFLTKKHPPYVVVGDTLEYLRRKILRPNEGPYKMTSGERPAGNIWRDYGNLIYGLSDDGYPSSPRRAIFGWFFLGW